MTNPFITIWTVIKRMARSLEAKSWQMILLSAGLIYMVWSFICIHQIKRTELSYHVNEILGLTQNGKSELKIHINNGLLFEQDSIPENTLIYKSKATHNIIKLDTTATNTTHNIISEDSTSSTIAFKQSVYKKFTYATLAHSDYYKADSILQIVAPQELCDHIVNLFHITVRNTIYSRRKIAPFSKNINKLSIYKGSPYFDLTTKHTIQHESSNFYSNKHISIIESYAGISIIPEVVGNLSNFLGAYLSTNTPHFNNYPSIWELWDISQKTYRIYYTTDSDPASTIYANGKPIPDNKLLPLGNLKVDFMGPVELLPMSPEPDIVSMSGFEFTDSLKLRQIMRDGLEFHAKFPQTESLQSARIFFLTTFISLFFTLLCTLGYRLIRYHCRHWNDSKGKKSEEASPQITTNKPE